MLGAMQTGRDDKAVRSCIVTGASSGIGEACARALARAGFRVAIAARRADRLESLAKEIAQEGGMALPVACDLGDESATAGLVEKTLDAFGRIDVLVNNAGFSPAAAMEQLPRSEVVRTFEVNLISGLQLIGAVSPIMREQGGGRILNMSSLAGSVPAPMAVVYSSTKAAIDMASDCLRLELAPWNIEVSSIVPGFVDTDTFDNSREMARDLRADEANPYRQRMFDMDDFAKGQLKNAISPAQVADVVVKAATARRLRSRYYAPFGARLQATLLGAVPARLLERILLRLYKVPSPRV
jgi:NAD(P)-dependent dehydrogenase (short-subunit alcohol dehydrogenase family)